MIAGAAGTTDGAEIVTIADVIETTLGGTEAEGIATIDGATAMTDVEIETIAVEIGMIDGVTGATETATKAV